MNINTYILEVYSTGKGENLPRPFYISGDFNKVSVTQVLRSYGALQQVCSVATRNKYAIYAYTHGPVTGSGFMQL